MNQSAGCRSGGRYTVDRETHQIVGREFAYVDIPTRAVAAFILERFGLDPEQLQDLRPEKKKPTSSGTSAEAGDAREG